MINGMGGQQAIHYYLPADGLVYINGQLSQVLDENLHFDLVDFVFLVTTKNLKMVSRGNTPADPYAASRLRWEIDFDFNKDTNARINQSPS